MKKIIAAVTTAIFAVGLALVGVASPASAHTAGVTGVATCQTDGTISIKWTYVQSKVPAAPAPDSQSDVVVSQHAPATSFVGGAASASQAWWLNGTSTPDHSTVGTQTGIPTLSGNVTTTFTQTKVPAAAAGVATVTIDSTWPTFGIVHSTGTVSFSACTQPSAKDASAAVTTTAATCSSPATLVLGDVVNAKWGTPTRTTGPGTYSVTATALAHHVFSDGSATEVFYGTLADKLDYQSAACLPAPKCLPASSVSYTYLPATNSGVITVTDVARSTHVLCAPFWVTATSWKYTTNSTWPQTRDVVDPLPRISAPGTYDYAAAVTCGQGDIYASFTSSPTPGPDLYGPSNPFPEHFLHDMGFTGPNPTYVQSNTSCWHPTPETGTPTFTTAVCDSGTPANTVTLPAVPGGIWSWMDATHSGSYPIGTGYSGGPVDGFANYTYTLADGDSHDGYAVTPGPAAHWTPLDTATYCVTPSDPTVTPAVCLPGGGYTGGTITVFLKTGLVFTLTDHNGTVIPLDANGKASGLAPGDYTVSVVAEPGYTLYGAGNWPLTVTVPLTGDCLPTFALWHPLATGTQAVCTANGPVGTITLQHAITGQGAVDEIGKVDYKLQEVGSATIVDLGATQTSVSVAPGSYVVIAQAVNPADGLDPLSIPAGVPFSQVGNTIHFPITIAPAATDCQLPTDAVLLASVTGSHATCTPSSGKSGTLTLEHDSLQLGKVDYSVRNVGTGVTTDVGATVTSVAVVPGTYVVTARAVTPIVDTIDGSNRPDGSLVFDPIVIPASSGPCGSLAFTGVDAMGTLTLGLGLMFLGIGVMFLRRRNARTAE